MIRFIGLAVLLFAGALVSAAPQSCMGGINISKFRIYANPGGSPWWKPIRQLNSLGGGATVKYFPAGETEEDAEIALVVAPRNSKDEIKLLDVKPAGKEQAWDVPYDVSVMAVVYGPDGLNGGRVRKLVTRDPHLVLQLADYAEQTALVESVMREVAEGRSGSSLNAALSGLASRMGPSAAMKKDAPLDQQMMSMFRAVNPALAGFDPLVDARDARTAQTVSLAAAVAGLFFNNTVGLAASSALLFQNLRQVIFPQTEFRSSFARIDDSATLSLCAKLEKHAPRTKIAYLWALKMPNDQPPVARVAIPDNWMTGAKFPVRLKVQEAAWPSVRRLENWRLVGIGETVELPVEVRALDEVGSLEVKVPELELPEGPYHLIADLDWRPVSLSGEIWLRESGGVTGAEMPLSSLDRLVQGEDATVAIRGVDLQFLEKASIRPGQGEGKPRELEFVLPLGIGGGVQQSARIYFPLADLTPGQYWLVLGETGGQNEEIPVRILPPHPQLKGLPLRVNVGEKEQILRIEGEGLDRLKGMQAGEAAGGEIERSEEGATWRVRLAKDVKPGQKFPLWLQVEGVHKPVEVTDGLQVMGPRPKVEAARIALPGELGIRVREGELPADASVTFQLRGSHFSGAPEVAVACRESKQSLETIRLRSGQQTPLARLDLSRGDLLFLSLTPGRIGQPGCELELTVQSTEGASDPFRLGRVVRLPKIEKLVVTAESVADNVYAARLEGYNLETIEKTGWESGGWPVDALPKGMAGEGQRQSLEIAVPWPSPHPKANLHVWLRGETEGRPTRVNY